MFCPGMQSSPRGRAEPSSFRREEPGSLVDLPRGEGGRLTPPLVREGWAATARSRRFGAFELGGPPGSSHALPQAASGARVPCFTVYQDSPSVLDGASPDLTAREADVHDLRL